MNIGRNPLIRLSGAIARFRNRGKTQGLPYAGDCDESANLPVSSVNCSADAKTETEDDFDAASEVCDSGSQGASSDGLGIVLAVLGGSVLVVWIVSVIRPIVQMVLESSGWRLGVALVLLAIPLATVVVAAVVVLGRYFRMPRIVSYSRERFGNDRRLARRLKRRYLSRWDGVEFRKGKWTKELNESLKWLWSNEIGDGGMWLDKLREFQDALDKEANSEIRRFSRMIGGGTVASQWKMGDMAVVIVVSAVMLRRLGALYRQRVGIVAAVSLSLRWVLNIYVAGGLQSKAKVVGANIATVTGKILEKVAPFVGNLGGAFAADPVSGAGASKVVNLGGKLIAAAGEYFVNNMLAYRLGAYYKENLHFIK